MNVDGREEQGRLLAVGDIHGCLDHLERLLAEVEPTAADRVVFLGDYIDRGADSRGVVDLLLDFRLRFPLSVFLRGNHEQMFLDFLSGRDKLTFLYNGGLSTLESYRQQGELHVPQEHLDFLKSLPLSFETEHFVFAHAGLRPGIPVAEQVEQDLLWIRGEFLDSDYDWGKTVVFGHTPLAQPLWQPNKVGLDTGAVYGRSLTCCDLESRRCWASKPPATG